MSDIFREVDEELRQEKLSQLWKQYGLYIIIGAVGIRRRDRGHSRLRGLDVVAVCRVGRAVLAGDFGVRER